MDIHKLKAEKRELVGRKVKTLRTAGGLPANIFGKGVKSQSVAVNRSEFDKVFAEAGETGIIELQIDKENTPVLVANVQSHPVTAESLHVDFRQVNMKEKIEAQVPVEMMGESPAEKQGLGIVVQQNDEVTVEALPMDLPEKFEVDIANLSEVGQSITVANLTTSEKVKILDEAEKVLVMVEEVPEEEVAPVPVAEGEQPVEGEATEAPAADEKPAESGEEEKKEESSE